MPYAADYKLADLLGVAGATIGIIIAGAILLGGFDARYTHLFERYRALTGEYRSDSVSDPRRGSLRAEIHNYRRRINVINIATSCLTLALCSFVVTVVAASLSVAYPTALAFRATGTVSLLFGLALIAVAVILGLLDTLLSRAAILPEVADFDDLGDGFKK